MRLTQIGSGDAAASLLLKLRDTRILLDCGIDPGSTLSFAPSSTSSASGGISNAADQSHQGGPGAPTAHPRSHQQPLLEGTPRLWCPLLDAAVLQGVHVLLASSPAALLALPVLTERCGFKGKVFATSAALKFARLWFEELLRYQGEEAASGKEDPTPAWLQEAERRSSGENNQPSASSGPCAARGGLFSPKESSGSGSGSGSGARDNAAAASVWEGRQASPASLLRLCWQRRFSAEEVEAALARVEGVTYRQRVSLPGGLLVAHAEPSGECIGGAAWILEDDQRTRIGYLPHSRHNGHAAQLETSALEDLDVLIVGEKAFGGGQANKAKAAEKADSGAVSRDGTPSKAEQNQPGPVDQFAQALEDIIAEVLATAAAGGSVLLPAHCASGIAIDLTEKVHKSLQKNNLGHIPIYWVSPAATETISSAVVSMEWLSKPRQSRVYLPEAPFRHENWMKSGRLVPSGSLAELQEVQGRWKEPCVAVVSPFSWQGGPAQQLADKWGADPRSVVIVTETSCLGRPPPPLASGLLPRLQGRKGFTNKAPARIRVKEIPLMAGWGPKEAAAALAKLCPRHLLIPEAQVQAIAALPASDRSGALSVESLVGYRLLERAHVALPKPAQAALMEPGLALKVSMRPVPGWPGLSAARCSAVLSLYNGRWCLSDDPAERQGSQPRDISSEAAGNKCIWGAPTAEDLCKALQEKGFHGISVAEDAVQVPASKRQRSAHAGKSAALSAADEGFPVVKITVAEASGFITMEPNRIHVSAPSAEMRAALAEAVMSRLNTL